MAKKQSGINRTEWKDMIVMKPFSDFEKYCSENAHNVALHIAETIKENISDDYLSMFPAEEYKKHYFTMQQLIAKTTVSYLQMYHNWISEQINLPDTPHHESNQ